MNKVINRIEKPSSSIEKESTGQEIGDDYIFVKTEYRMQKIFLKDIYYVQAMKDYLCMVTDQEKVYTLLNFKKLEEKLPESRFMRIHRSYLIAIEKIESVERNTIKILDERIPISDTYKEKFYAMLEKKKIG